MLIRIDIMYPHLMASGQFPAAPSTLFQSMIAANGHRLNDVRDVLEALERGKCLRIVQHRDATPIVYRTAVPRLPKQSKLSGIKVYRDSSDSILMLVDGSPERLMKPQQVFMLEPMSVHVSYYWHVEQEFPIERLRDVLRVSILGRGESVTISSVSLVNKLSEGQENSIVWEPARAGRSMDVPYPGFLRNLRLFYDHKKSNLKVRRKSETFGVKRSNAAYAPILYKLVDADGEKFSYPQEDMADIAAMMRHSMITATAGKVDGDYVSGHSKPHPYYLPLPSIGMEHVDGNIRRVIVAEPASHALLADHLAAVTSLPLINDSGKLVCYAVRETDSDGVFSQYLSASNVFRTVTPMILDRAGGTQRVGKRIEALIMKAGFPQPARISFNKTWWNGKLPVSVRRAQVHVEVEFFVKVSGPVVGGIASGYGIGLFAAK